MSTLRARRGQLTVLDAGIGNTIQDQGRPGFRQQGVPLAGALDRDMARCANALVHNESTAACLEMRGLGPRLRCDDGPLLVGLCGTASAHIQRGPATQHPFLPWTSATLFPGDELQIQAVTEGCAYLAIQAGWDVPSLMGSCSSFSKWNAPGLLSRQLAIADVLTTHPLSPSTPLAVDGDPGAGLQASRALRAKPWRPAPLNGPVMLRAMPGPQCHHFTAESQAQFWSTTWTASAAQDRMGLRLQGEPVHHLSPDHRDIVSDAVTPGTIQVPADGQPIALLADCQTMGGYPKIAVVISADLPLLAHCPAGTPIRFSPVTLPQAHAAMHAIRDEWRAWADHLQPYSEPGFIDHQALQLHNLISGAVDATQL